MTDHSSEKIILDKIVSDEIIKQRRPLFCLGQSCSKSLILISVPVFHHIAGYFGLFPRIQFAISIKCTWLFVSCSAYGTIVPTPRKTTSFFSTKIGFHYQWLDRQTQLNCKSLTIGLTKELFNEQ